MAGGGGRVCGIVDPGGALMCWDDTQTCSGCDPPAGSFSMISGGEYGECGLGSTGALVCWNGSAGASAPGGAFSRVSVGESHACAVRTTGSIACWGNDDYGQATPPGP
jgi:alpha-tubulin suppressor-like RCC1 family protein